ncbi:MAG TPA: DUF1538 domain-containing protein [Bacillota bacterium]|nr:DUF1538 domain-containing protein [Bacillota bacterium]HQC47982.1 DUF1538 domain-containing protein [Bacillota bacterium]
MGLLNEKIKEVLQSLAPVTIFVLVLHFTIAPLTSLQLGQFLLGAFLLLMGLSVFLVGVDLGATPIGIHSGHAIVRSGKMPILLMGGIILGFLISIAEPDLHILATQIEQLTGGSLAKWTMVIVVSVGVGLLVMVGFWRIVRQIRIRYVLWLVYGIILILACLSPLIFHDFAFDASGATTGAITTPFILALAAGVAKLTTSKHEDARDQFGLVGFASAGAIVAVLAMGAIQRTSAIGAPQESATPIYSKLFESFGLVAPSSLRDSLLSVAPLVIVFFLLQISVIKIRKRDTIRIYLGMLFCYIGLTIFMIGVMGGFMSTGHILGAKLVTGDKRWMTAIAGFFLGMVTVIAEPAVHVLTQSIEEVTEGAILRKVVLAFLSIGVAFAVMLAVIRIYTPGLHLWHILLPGYILVMIMSFFTPDIFVGIAFDAGGVASGPMTATFILAFTQGIAAGVPGADPLLDGFGVIALVALAPLITLQLLGLISIIQANKRKKSQLVLHEGLAAEGKQAIDTLASDDKSADVERRELIRSLGHEETLASFEVDEHDRNE